MLKSQFIVEWDNLLSIPSMGFQKLYHFYDFHLFIWNDKF